MTDNPNRLAGKILAVAGGGGIGNEIARRYAAEGATVILGDLDGARAEETAAKLRGEGYAVTAGTLDGGDEASVRGFFAAIDEEHGGLDGVHANFASFSDAGTPDNIVDLPIEIWDEVMRVNSRGYVLVTKAAVPLIVKRGGGAIVYTSSGAAYSADPNRAAYAMSKESTHALSRHVATAFGPQNVRANVVAPGFILHAAIRDNEYMQTTAREVSPLKNRFGDAPDIAAMSALLVSDEGGFITGQVINVDGGMIMRP